MFMSASQTKTQSDNCEYYSYNKYFPNSISVNATFEPISPQEIYLSPQKNIIVLKRKKNQ